MDAQYLKNCWYMAGWASELDGGQSLARTICDLPILVFRDKDSVSCSILDMCPHRFAPLSMGQCVDGVVTCPYHGLSFDRTGKCVKNPHGAITSSMQVRAFPTVERYQALWIWFGEPQDADEVLIPPLDFQNERSDSAISFGYLNKRADYQLFVDNIMDLSHADFLHANTLGGSFVGTKQEVKDTGLSLKVRWSQVGVPASPLHISLGTFASTDLLDRFTEVQWFAPGVMILTSAFGASGAVENDYSWTIGAHVMTPESKGSLHYFFSTTRNFRKDDQNFNDVYSRTRDKIFEEEDGPMIEAVQSRMGNHDLFDLKPLLLKTDEAAIRVRRKMTAMLKAEQSRPGNGPAVTDFEALARSVK